MSGWNQPSGGYQPVNNYIPQTTQPPVQQQQQYGSNPSSYNSDNKNTGYNNPMMQQQQQPPKSQQAPPSQPLQQQYYQQQSNQGYYAPPPQQQQTSQASSYQKGVNNNLNQQSMYSNPQQSTNGYGGYQQEQQKANYNPYGIQEDFMSQIGSNPAAQIGMQLGSKALKDGEEIMKKNLNKYISIPQLKYYFNVSNTFVLYKISLLLFPFRHQSWSRAVLRNETGQVEGFKPPREDLNAPDLYIPVMSFVTYVLLFGILLGSKGGNQFTPDVLGITSTTALFILFTEVFLIRLGCYLLSIPSSAPLLDLLAYCGYKYIGVITTCIAKLIPGLSQLYIFLVFIYTMLAYGFFMLRSLKYIVFPDQQASAATGQNPRKRKIHFLLIVVAVQIAFAWYTL